MTNKNILRGIQTQERVLANLPGTVAQIAKSSGLGKDCAEKAIRRLRKAGVLVICGTTPRPDRGGSPSFIFGEVGKRKCSMLITVPVTQHKTQWIGGQHPCGQFNPFCQEAA